MNSLVEATAMRIDVLLGNPNGVDAEQVTHAFLLPSAAHAVHPSFYPRHRPSRFSSSATARVVLMTVSGLSDMLWMPHSTMNSANSG